MRFWWTLPGINRFSTERDETDEKCPGTVAFASREHVRGWCLDVLPTSQRFGDGGGDGRGVGDGLGVWVGSCEFWAGWVGMVTSTSSVFLGSSVSASKFWALTRP